MYRPRGSVSSSSNETNLATKTPFEGVSRDPPRLNVPLFPASNAVSRNEIGLHNLPRLMIPGSDALDDATSSGCHNIINEDDIVIAVMGPTGAGKSSFVNTVARREEAVIGYDLRSKTRALQIVRCPHPDGRRNIVLVDTPGFDDTHLSDTYILKTIANWLKNTYQKDIKLSGLLYLHRISDNRMAGTPLRNLAVFQDLCGNENLKNVILVTTMWDEVQEDKALGEKREGELVSGFWKGMIGFGSRTHRYQGTYEAAWGIINLLDLEEPRQKRAPLQIQREMVDRQLPLHETSAAKTLLRSLVQLAGEFKKAWTKMRSGTRRKVGLKNLRGRLGSTSTPSTIRSSESSWSVVSSIDTASTASHDSRMSCPVESTSLGCSTTGRQDVLLATITGLGYAREITDVASIPALQRPIETVIQVARLIQGMGGTHHAITRIVENYGWLLDEITRHVAQSRISSEMKKTLKSFQRELVNLQKVVKNKEKDPSARFFLQDADIQTIAACTASIKEAYSKATLPLDNNRAIARLEDQLTALRNDEALRRCECHQMSVIHE